MWEFMGNESTNGAQNLQKPTKIKSKQWSGETNLSTKKKLISQAAVLDSGCKLETPGRLLKNADSLLLRDHDQGLDYGLVMSIF